MQSVNGFHRLCLSPCWPPSVRDADKEVLSSGRMAKGTPMVLFHSGSFSDEE